MKPYYADPVRELRAAYQDISVSQPAVEEVLKRLPRLYAAIEAVLIRGSVSVDPLGECCNPQMYSGRHHRDCPVVSEK